MVRITGLSDKPCFICGKREHTVEVNFDDKSFKGVLCIGDVYKKVKPKTDLFENGESAK